MDPHADTWIQALRLAAIVADADDAIVSKDTNGVITSWNAGAERMFGYTAADAIGQSIRMIIPPDRQSEEDFVLSRIRRGERVDHFETQRCRRNGERLNSRKRRRWTGFHVPRRASAAAGRVSSREARQFRCA